LSSAIGRGPQPRGIRGPTISSRLHLVASGDRDSFQLASDKTAILYPVRAGEMVRIGPANVDHRRAHLRGAYSQCFAQSPSLKLILNALPFAH
jgi:hypothetical protein